MTQDQQTYLIIRGTIVGMPPGRAGKNYAIL
jgi:hypothetical protein